jgi:peptidoglycan/LPS O-acetylase OafA/YrhL
MVLLGQVSFSLYLVHFAVLDLLSWTAVEGLFPRNSDVGSLLYFACLLSISTAVAYLCYRMIELPGIALGKRVITLLNRPPAAAHVPTREAET